ncbi:MAG: HlyD family efflux transporter periplasmic adaptor subunit [Bacteroidales bacterium]|nr:HlyD family efflux transporter periplasmic adaptor subunit [Bacteroidales bacterium]
MKKSIFIFLISLIFISCSNNGNKSDAYGNFETKETIISSEARGKLITLNVEEGKKLSKGEVVGFIDTTQLYLKKEQLYIQKKAVATKIQNIEAQVNVVKEQLNTLLIEKKRLEKLLKDGAATTQKMDEVNGKENLLNSQIKSIEIQKTSIYYELDVISQQIKQVQDQIDKCFIINPINGTVLEKYIEPYEIAVIGKPLYKIADLDKMELRVYVSGAQLSEVILGNKVEVKIDKNEKEFITLSGKIIWISNQAEFTPKIIQTKEERVNMVYAVKVLVNNDGIIKIGMPGEVNFTNETLIK